LSDRDHGCACRKFKLGRNDDAIRPGLARTKSFRWVLRGARAAHLSPGTGACATRSNARQGHSAKANAAPSGDPESLQYEEAVRIAAEAYRRVPRAEVAEYLAKAERARADYFWRTGDSTAEDALEQASATARRMASRHPGRVVLIEAEVNALERLGDLKGRKGSHVRQKAKRRVVIRETGFSQPLGQALIVAGWDGLDMLKVIETMAGVNNRIAKP
jgi:hypothetical protein